MPTPSTVRRSTSVAACVALVVLALVGGRAAMATVSATTTPEEFSIGGDVDGLHPGVIAVLDARVRNPWDAAIVVHSIGVLATDAGPDCPGTMLEFTPTTGSITIPARSEAVVGVPVTLSAAASDACRGATWPLEFTARALGPDGVDRTVTGSVGPPSSGPRDLAATGAAITSTVAVGVALVLLGFLLTRSRRHRTAQRTAPAARNAR